MVNHSAPEPNYPALGTITGLTMAALGCLGCIFGYPVADAHKAAPELSSAAPTPLFAGPMVMPALRPLHAQMRLTDFSRMSGDTDAGPSAPSTGARARSKGDAPELHHFEIERHAHVRPGHGWAEPAAHGRHRGIRDDHRLHGAHRAGPDHGHRHLDGHGSGRGAAERHDHSGGRHGGGRPGRHHADHGHGGRHAR